MALFYKSFDTTVSKPDSPLEVVLVFDHNIIHHTVIKPSQLRESKEKFISKGNMLKDGLPYPIFLIYKTSCVYGKLHHNWDKETKSGHDFERKNIQFMRFFHLQRHLWGSDFPA